MVLNHGAKRWFSDTDPIKERVTEALERGDKKIHSPPGGDLVYSWNDGAGTKSIKIDSLVHMESQNEKLVSPPSLTPCLSERFHFG